MSLRIFHMVFILCAIVGSELFGGWALNHYRHDGDPVILLLGILCLVGGLGLAAYALWFTTKAEREHLR